MPRSASEITASTRSWSATEMIRGSRSSTLMRGNSGTSRRSLRRRSQARKARNVASTFFRLFGLSPLSASHREKSSRVP
jgi:hypothetical protein